MATLGVLLFSVILGFVGKRIVNAGLIPPAAMISGLSPVGDFLKVRSGVDSWAPMLTALHQIEDHPETSVYQAVFFDRHKKFQYPLTSLLPLWAAQRIGLSDDKMLAALRIGSWLAVCCMAGISAVIGVVLLRAYSVSKPLGLMDRVTAVIGILFSCLLFYPFMRGYELGQAQTFLSFGFALAFLCWMLGKDHASGAILGGLALVKPQYAVILIWMVFRRKTNAAVGFLACAGLGLALSRAVSRRLTGPFMWGL
jgi:alpha-1,2-mannosyltransferase